MGKKVLLIADDEDMNRMIISKFLKNDYEIIQAEDGQKAMDVIHSTHIDVLLLDIIMPELNGLEVLELIKKERELEHIGILVATSTKEQTERTALSMGADDIVSKPYDPVVIRRRIENILAVKEMQTQKEQLQNSDFEALMHEKKEALSKKIGIMANNIIKFTDVIDANKNNQELISEITADIRTEANDIWNTVNEEG